VYKIPNFIYFFYVVCTRYFKNLKGNLMKFVSKLSVLSFVVLIFSFMNVAQAKNKNPPPYCEGSARLCDDINKTNQTDDKKAFICNRTYQGVHSNGHATQCRWTVKWPGLKQGGGVKVDKDGKVKEVWICNGTGGPCRVPGDTTTW
jgi:hypothetical protein